MPHTLTTVQPENLRFDNVRTDFGNLEALRLLGESMLKSGQIHPIIVNSNNLVIDGERRVRAARMVGLKELLALVTDELLSDPQIREIQFASAFHRADLSAWDKAQAMAGFKADHADWSNRQIADHLAIDASLIPRHLAVFSCIPAVQDAMKAGHIGLKAVYEISKENEADQPALLAKALSGGSADAVARERRHRGGNGGVATAVKMTRIRCELASGVQVTASGEALSLDDFVETLSEALKAAKKALADGLDAKTFSHVMRDRSRHSG